MYVMFTGFLHGAALTGSAGISAKDFADRAIPFLTAMTGGMAAMAETVDRADYATDVQPLEWTELDTLIRACREAGISSAPIVLVDELVRAQIDQGHGAEAFARIHQGLIQD
nr:hypothetical protein [Microlunatus soli]